MTLSNYISMASATGMMACLTFFANLFMWLAYLDVSRKISRYTMRSQSSRGAGGSSVDANVSESVDAVLRGMKTR